MELDKVFQVAGIGAWDDVVKPGEPRSLRVESAGASDVALDYVSVWSGTFRERPNDPMVVLQDETRCAGVGGRMLLVGSPIF